MRHFLRWLTAPKRTPLDVVAAFILGNAAGVEAGIRSPAWVTIVIVFVVMGGVALLADLLRRVSASPSASDEECPRRA